jgi:transcriptional regulator with XRE-family HTH domain
VEPHSRTEPTSYRSWNPTGGGATICPVPGATPGPTTSERAIRNPGTDLRTAVGGAIRAARMRAGLSLDQLARRSDGRYQPSSLGGYERGERAISVVRFCELARLLGVPPDQLLGDALSRASPQGRREVTIEIGDLPDSEVGRQTAAYVHTVRSSRDDYLSNVVTLRAGDLQVIADATGLEVRTLLSRLGDAVRRVGSD